MICRVLPYLVQSGPAQMALDEALLESASERPTAAAVRTYEWSEPTLSLGYFQELADALAEPRWADVPIVRRATGGGAIWHEHELTYAVVVPRTHRLGSHPVDLYHAVHGAIAGLLQSRGAPARRRGVDPDRPERPFLCFLDRDPEDLVVGTSKVVGSAQRRRSGAVLQHGSILLAQAHRTPELPGLEELSGLDPRPASWAEAVQAAIVGALDLAPRMDAISAAEIRQAADLERDRYRGASWTRRR
jgi:lipoate-protein ligase A